MSPVASRTVVRWLGVTQVPTSGRTAMRARRWVQEPPATTGDPGLATAVRSDTEDIVLARLALDVGREIVALLGEVGLAMIALGETVVGDVKHAPLLPRKVRPRAMRHVAVEEDDVACPHRQGLEGEAGHVGRLQRSPFGPEQPAAVLAGRDFKAAILQRRIVDRDHHSNEERGVFAPPRLLVLMRLEAVA